MKLKQTEARPKRVARRRSESHHRPGGRRRGHARRPAASAASGESASLIDTSRMNEGERAALELAEAAREPTGSRAGFAGSLFLGKPDWKPFLPYPEQPIADREAGRPFLESLERYLEERVDADAIDATGEIPDEQIQDLAAMGAFGIKIPRELGGLGLSQTNYSRAAMLLGGHCGNLTALLSAHQSIGVPQPLLKFGTEEQRTRFLPRCASGEISAFALTEAGVGSDPARMATTAEKSADGRFYVLNGEKLWCTNGLKAGLMVVMARMVEPGSPAASGPPSISAFVVERDTPGVEVRNRCRFMGLKALYNGVIHFRDVKVPVENLVLGEGRGLKVALSTLNTGRITLPAACAGMARRCREWSRDWAAQREQWGAPIGRHEAIAQKLARLDVDSAAIEDLVLYVSALVDREADADIRIEAALAKLWGTETGWDLVNETMQIRGGRGYETVESLKARGEAPVPVERFLRDSRINTIFEGSSEIMRLFIAREALQPHLERGAAVLDRRLPWSTRIGAAARAAVHYAGWYPSLWRPRLFGDPAWRELPKATRKELRRVERLSRQLARSLFHAMLRHGPGLEKRQVLLGRLIDAGAELFVLAVVAARCASAAGSEAEQKAHALRLRYLGRRTEMRVRDLLRGNREAPDAEGRRISEALMEGAPSERV